MWGNNNTFRVFPEVGRDSCGLGFRKDAGSVLVLGFSERQDYLCVLSPDKSLEKIPPRMLHILVWHSLDLAPKQAASRTGRKRW